jgi:amino acid transporter
MAMWGVLAVGQAVSASRPNVGGVETKLERTMSGFGALLITLSCLSPGLGVFVVSSDVIKQAGTGVFICFGVATLLSFVMAAVYGELASAFPHAGGEYTILRRTLGPAWGFAVLSLNLLGFGVAQALSGLGVATYLAAVWPGLPVRATAAVLVVLVTATAVLNIRLNAALTGVFLAVELLALTLLATLGFAHGHRGLMAALMRPEVPSSMGFSPPSLALLGAATAGAIYAFNGYGAVVFFGEELREAPRQIAGVVFLSLSIAVVAELVPIAGVLLGVPDPRALTTVAAPIPAAITQLGGAILARAMSLAVALAIFNAMIAVALVAGRQLYSTGRDGLWPRPVSQALGRVHRRLGSPWVATVTMGTAALAACLLDPHILVLILGNGSVAIYAGMCLAALIGRRSGATRHTQYRMPLFPLPPLFALGLLVGVVAFDMIDPAGRRGLAATAVTIVGALLYYALMLRKCLR